ncbi:flagellar protein FlaG [Kushneria indalinina]|uniref:FlaG protein n=1 Tax=Kushneria indalinina DSM 14324 TaxID=1122140 RepID=A0A3D9DZV6_9GAMM|nr:flagellar protein FlaG [Kushneria indalinina]REC96320.1 FlaG protein [Kushneria indalinina DSM 14324]
MIINPIIQSVSSTAVSSRPVTASALPVTALPLPFEKEDNTTGLEKAVSRLNQDFAPIGIEFDIHDDSGRIVTRVIDRASGDVLRQIPTEEVLHIARLAARQQGRLLQTTA